MKTKLYDSKFYLKTLFNAQESIIENYENVSLQGENISLKR